MGGGDDGLCEGGMMVAWKGSGGIGVDFGICWDITFANFVSVPGGRRLRWNSSGLVITSIA